MARTVCSIGDEYLPASFNGVPFDAVEVTSEHGRRGAEGEFPFGEFTAYADLGRKIRVYTLRAKLQEDNHVLQAAALIAVCELPGPGVLVHPTRGIVSAACRSVRLTDNIEEGSGITEVDMEFVEGNAWPNGLSLVGTFLGLAIGAVIQSTRDNFNEHYDPAIVTSNRRAAVTDAAATAVGSVRDEYQRAITVNGSTDERKYRALSDLNVVASDATLLADSATVDKAISLGMNGIATETTSESRIQAMRRIANTNAKVSTLDTLQGGESQNAVYSLTRTLSGVYIAQAATEKTYRRMQEAFDDIDLVRTLLTEEADIARDRCDNAHFLELSKFMIDAEQILYDKAYRSPALLQYDFGGAVNPLVAAYSVFNDSKRHRELEQQNYINDFGQIGPLVIASSI